MSDRIVLSGIQPTGNIHLGNYLGAVKRWVEEQENGQNNFCIVDMHAITVEQDAQKLSQSSLDMAALLIACGLNPEKITLFIQSQNPDHANLAWVLNCVASLGQLNRMTQFKEKSDQKDFVSVGLFDYPVLMAADILLYNTTEVPVGEDQVQHVELTRDLAERFNSRYGETFVLPKAVLPENGARIMSLTDPTKKMSKSDNNDNSRINLLDNKDTIINKFKSAVTDSESSVKYDPQNKPGISNLLEIYSRVTNKNVQDSQEQFKDTNYGDFKLSVAQSVVDILSPIQDKFKELRSDEQKLQDILHTGAQKARDISSKKLDEVYTKVGFVK